MSTAGWKMARPVLVALMVAGVLVQGSVPASAAPTVSGTARGEGVMVSTLPATVVHLSEAKSEIDSAGIGVGTNVAHGTAKPAEVVASGVTTLRAADSETSAPPASSDSDGVPSANLPGVLSVSALSSGSSADTLPRSSNSARIAQATVLSTLVNAGVITGESESRRAGNDSLSTASAEVANVSVSALGIPTISVKAAQASASATATGIAPNLPGGSKGQILSCSVAEVKIGSTTLVNIPCDGRELVAPPVPLSGVLSRLLSIKAGTPSTGATATTATAKVDALTITIKLTGQKIVLGSVEVSAAVGAAVTTGPCVFPARPTASGAALGDVVRANDFITKVQADVALSQASIDEAGVGGGPKSATADGMIGQVAQPTVPLLTQIVDSHATAPPPTSNGVTVADASIVPILTSQTLKTDASASANPDGSAPRGAADATAEKATVALGALVGLNSTTIASDASSVRNPGNVTSGAHATVESTTGTVAGLALDVQALKSSASASATGSPGGASAATSFQVLRVQLGGLVINATPPAGYTVDVLSPGLALVRLTFGAGSTTMSADGTSASAIIDALRIQVLPLPGGDALETVVIGHSEASAKVPQAGSGAFVAKKIAVAFDEPRTFGDGPVTVAPGQKFTYLICYANLGPTTLTNVVITDVLNPNLVRPYDALFPLPPNMSITGGTPYNGTTTGGTLTSSPFTLAPGQTGSVEVTFEVLQTTPPGALINNSATLSFSGGSVTSNNVAINVGFSPNSPRLSGPVVSQSFDSTTRIFTVNFNAQNAAQAGTAFNAALVTVATTSGVTPLGVFPITLGDIPPGGSVPFTIQFHIAAGTTSFFADLLFRANGSDGHTYLFD